MSGIEVVGVVLGVLPLAAKAVDGYLKYTSNIRKYDNDLRELLQDFVVEDTRLRNSCRNLLNDIIPFDNIESGHGTNPFSPKLSSTVRNKLKLKLYDSYPMFEQTMENIKTVASDLKLKLNLQEDGTVRCPFPLKTKVKGLSADKNIPYSHNKGGIERQAFSCQAPKSQNRIHAQEKGL